MNKEPYCLVVVYPAVVWSVVVTKELAEHIKQQFDTYLTGESNFTKFMVEDLALNFETALAMSYHRIRPNPNEELAKTLKKSLEDGDEWKS